MMIIKIFFFLDYRSSSETPSIHQATHKLLVQSHTKLIFYKSNKISILFSTFFLYQLVELLSVVTITNIFFFLDDSVKTPCIHRATITICNRIKPNYYSTSLTKFLVYSLYLFCTSWSRSCWSCDSPCGSYFSCKCWDGWCW